MNTSMKSVAKRLIFSLVAASALSGCAVYGPGPYAYGTDVNGQPVTVAPNVVTTPYYPYSSYDYDPWFVGPPVYFNFGIRSYGGYRYGGRRWHR